ncbi:MAG: hypothetical protein CVU39_07665 [Chloroflexi bacterium HGW-Chloroflexi-10]|nr:MAG: hypothetical protein CVU39_07665 [Chloroflexi bacterium HGW-Chloroflexi-10]
MKTGHVLNDTNITELRRVPKSTILRKQLIREETRKSTPTVTIYGCQYLVDFDSGYDQRFHRVNKNKECDCGAAYCEAIEIVRQYLQAGGVRAPDPATAFACPICGSKIYRDPIWDSRTSKEPGWRCARGGLGHFLQARSDRIRKQFAEHPWLIPPAPGYPGVRRDEVLTSTECEAIQRKVYLESGYDPTA